MSDPYVGEIRMFAGNFAPRDWAYCHGQLLPIATYDVLFNLIGTTYGGDGQSTFALPDLRGRVAVHQGAGYVIGQSGGTETVTLTVNQIPAHTHGVSVSTQTAVDNDPALGVLAASRNHPMYSTAAPSTLVKQLPVSGAGGTQPHDNLMPSLVIGYIISLFGIYPTQV